MKSIAFAIALTLGGAAVAQTYNDDTGTNTTTDTSMTTDTSTNMTTDTSTMAMNTTSPVGVVVQPGNEDPERDARGIPVISAPAIVPPGWNGVVGTAMGGPFVDPNTGEVINDVDTYPACTATITDNCLQAYAMRR